MKVQSCAFIKKLKKADSVGEVVMTLGKRVAGLDRSSAEKTDDVVLAAVLN